MSPDLAAVLGTLDPTSDRAVFRQIADHLRDAIEKGRLAENEQIPSETLMVEHYGVARMTVRHAIQGLQSEGLVLAEHGRGVFVRPRPPVRRLASDRFACRNREQGKAAFIAEAEQAGSRPEVDSIIIREERPTRDISARLGTTREVLARHRRYLLDGQPVETAVSYIPLDIATGTAITEPNPGPGGIYARLEEAGPPSTTLTRKSAPGCPCLARPAPCAWLPASPCSTWSAPRMTMKAVRSKSATRSWPPTRTSWLTAFPPGNPLTVQLLLV